MSDSIPETIVGGSEALSACAEDVTGRERMTYNVLASWVGHMAVIAAGFVMPRFIDHHLGQVALGVWDFGWSLVNYFTLAQGGIGSCVNRYVAEHRATKDVAALNCTVASVLCIQIVLTLLVVLVTLGATWGVPSLLSRQLGDYVGEARWVVFLLGSSLAVQMLFDVFRGIITGCHRWDLHNGLLAGMNIVMLVGMIVALKLGGGLRGLAIANLGGAVLTEMVRVVVALRLCPELRIRLGNASWVRVKETFAFGGKTLAGDVARLLLYQTNSLVVVSYLGPAALAAYSRPSALVRHAQTFINKFAYVLTPTASSLQAAGQTKELRELFVRASCYGVFLALPMMLVLSILGGPILDLWMGSGYRQGAVLALLAMGHLFSMAQQPAMNVLTGLNAHGRPAGVNLVAALCAVGVAVVTVGPLRWGLLGAAAAVAMALASVNCGYVPVYACRRLGVPLWVYVRDSWAKPLAYNLPFAICLAVIRLACGYRPCLALWWAVIAGVLVLVPVYWRYVLPIRMKESVKASCLRGVRICLWWSGILRLWMFCHRHDITILMLHGAMDKDEDASWFPLWQRTSPQDMEHTIKVLSRHYTFISLAEAVDMLTGTAPPKPYSLVITFDDGYKNNLTHALPILRRYRVPATVFLTTGYIDRQEPFSVDRLDYAVQQAASDGLEIGVGGQTIALRGRDRIELQKSFLRLCRLAKASTCYDGGLMDNMERTAAALEARTGRSLAEIFRGDAWTALVGWQDVVCAGGEQVLWGSHTVDHLQLALVDAAIAKEQLARSKEAIERRTGQPCLFLAYPFGSINACTPALARQAGYLCAVTTEEGTNRVGDDMMTLRRIPFPSAGNAIETIMCVSGLSIAIHRVLTRPKRVFPVHANGRRRESAPPSDAAVPRQTPAPTVIGGNACTNPD